MIKKMCSVIGLIGLFCLIIGIMMADNEEILYSHSLMLGGVVLMFLAQIGEVNGKEN